MSTIKALSKNLVILGKPLMVFVMMTAIIFSATAGLTASVKEATVMDGDSVKTVYTTASDPVDIIDRAGVVMAANDEYTMTTDGNGNKCITVLRAFAVSVSCNSEKLRVITTGGTVGDILAKAGVQYSPDDNINYALSAVATPNMSISVLGVNYTTLTQEMEYEGDISIVYSDQLYEGQTRVTAGEAGMMMVTYSQRVVDGQVVQTSIIEETIVKEAVPAKQVVGTKKVATVTAAPAQAPAAKSESSSGAPTYLTGGTSYISGIKPSKDFELDANGVPLNYTKKLTGNASAYYAASGAHTSTGKIAQTGYVAVNPNIIPYGTKLFIRTPDGRFMYGYASAEDTGGFASWGTRIVDLYFNTYSECVRFGVRNVEIYVLG